MTDFILADNDDNPVLTAAAYEVKVFEDDITNSNYKRVGISIPSETNINFSNLSDKLGTVVKCVVDSNVIVSGTLFGIAKSTPMTSTFTEYEFSINIS